MTRQNSPPSQDAPLDCATCQDALSEFCEKALSPVRRKAVSDHLERCSECRGTFADLQTTLALLRAAPKEEPPAALVESVLAAVPAATAGRRRKRYWLRVAALLLFAFLLGLFAWREVGWRDRERALEAKIAHDLHSVELDHGKLRSAFEGLQARLEATDEQLEQTRRELAKATAAETELRAEWKRRQAEWTKRQTVADEQRLGSEQREAAHRLERTQLEAALKSALESERKLADRVAGLEERLRWVASTAPIEKPADDDPSGRQLVAKNARSSVVRPTAHVVVRDLGDHMRVELRGPRREVIPELLRMVEDNEDPEVVELALVTLEEQLRIEPAVEAPGAGDDGWLVDRWQGIVAAVTPTDAETVSKADTRNGSRAARLRAARTAWLREGSKQWNQKR